MVQNKLVSLLHSDIVSLHEAGKFGIQVRSRRRRTFTPPALPTLSVRTATSATAGSVKFPNGGPRQLTRHVEAQSCQSSKSCAAWGHQRLDPHPAERAMTALSWGRQSSASSWSSRRADEEAPPA